MAENLPVVDNDPLSERAEEAFAAQQDKKMMKKLKIGIQLTSHLLMFCNHHCLDKCPKHKKIMHLTKQGVVCSKQHQIVFQSTRSLTSFEQWSLIEHE
jgi:hypothetical protein